MNEEQKTEDPTATHPERGRGQGWEGETERRID